MTTDNKLSEQIIDILGRDGRDAPMVAREFLNGKDFEVDDKTLQAAIDDLVAEGIVVARFYWNHSEKMISLRDVIAGTDGDMIRG